MTSPLEGLIAATINTALQDIFFNATLTRGSASYSCKAIFDKWQKFLLGPTTASSYQVLVLANSLAVEPLIHDIITLQGTVLEVLSDRESKPAIEIDPARAVWILRSRPLAIPASSGGIGGAGEFNRIISFYRRSSQLVVGSTGYLGHDRVSETLLFAGITASLVCKSIGTTRYSDGVLPDDAPGPVRWDVFVSATDIPKGAIISRDIIVDDEANRYQVAAAYWTSAGWKIQTIRLEA